MMPSMKPIELVDAEVASCSSLVHAGGLERDQQLRKAVGAPLEGLLSVRGAERD